VYLDYRAKYFGDTRNPFLPPEKPKKIAQPPQPAQQQQPQPQQTLFQSSFQPAAQPQPQAQQAFGSSLFGGGFGQTGATAPSFAAPAASGFGFGAPAPAASTFATAGPAFGATTAPAFGSSVAPTNSFGGGQPAATPLFGTPGHSGQAGTLFSPSGSGALSDPNSKKKKK